MVQSSVADKQRRLVPLFMYSTLTTKQKFFLRVQLDKRLRGLGILGRGKLFSCFHAEHLEEATKLAEALILAATFDEFLDLAHQARDFVNPGLFIYAISVAILHREDCRGITLPPIQQVFPDKFVPINTIYETFKKFINNPEDDIYVEIEKTGNILDPEYNLAYFREDMGINAHHWHWHLVYPSTWNSEVTKKHKDRKGELFYYMHQQMCARYDCERLCNGLPRMIPFHNFHEPLEGYSSHLSSMINGFPYAARPNGMTLKDLDNVSIQDLERWRDRILDAIHLGYVEDHQGRETPLDEVHGLDILGDIIESSHESVNLNYYGSLHNWGHVMMASIQDPDGRYQMNPGVMDDTSTSLRDPIFYRWHRFIDDMFQEFKNRLDPYTKHELGFSGVEIASIHTVNEKSEENMIHTHMGDDVIDISHAYNFGKEGIKVHYKHLDHEPFTYEIKILNNTKKHKKGTVRIFLAPKCDELDNRLHLDDLRRLAIELDKFQVELHPGSNVVERKATDSSVTISPELSFSQLLHGERSKEHATEFCSCGWPQHLLVPKGNDHGMKYHLFGMVNDFLEDVVGEHSSDICIDAVSYCGAKDELYPDRKAMGFPFDRIIEEDDFAEWHMPNMAVAEVTIVHSPDDH